MGGTDLPLVFVTVGTDHHPFDRLIRWVDRWLESRGDAAVRCVVQHGTSQAPAVAERRPYLGYQEMEALVAEAAAVVCHGGPGSVMLCRGAGKQPIVVPRRHDLGEHVDDHQVVFARRIAAEGEIALAEDRATFGACLQRALEGEGTLDPARYEERVGEAVAEFERLVDRLMAPRR
jgi:UDP-N-acetylglucosamine transferase subunit ALG13